MNHLTATWERLAHARAINTRYDPSRLGQCYVLTARRIMDQAIHGDEASTLVHGSIQGAGAAPISHCWVIEGDGGIWEPATDTVYDPDAFYRLFSAEEEHRFTPEEAMLLLSRTKHFGPWKPMKHR